MMNEEMAFPNTFEEFVKEYSFKDSDEVYTNNCELIPAFRVMQGYSHFANRLRADAIEEFYNRLLVNKKDINLANNPWNYIELVAREMIDDIEAGEKK